MARVIPIPAGNHTVTAGLVVRNAAQAIEFYKVALGAAVLGVALWPDGKSVMHAELQIGDSKIYLGDENPEWGLVSPEALGGSPVSLHIYTEDCDAMLDRALAAGATVKVPVADMFWGDRYCKIADPFGHLWSIATHKEDVSFEEMELRGKVAMTTMVKK